MPTSTGDPETDAIIAKYYRWWTLKAWLSSEDIGVKLGPISVFGYRWFDARWRISWTLHCGREHIAFGGPLD